jgi:hypothetical protein
MAGVVFQQGMHPDRMLTGQVIVDHRVRQWDQQALAAVAAFDTGFSQTPARHSLAQAGE